CLCCRRWRGFRVGSAGAGRNDQRPEPVVQTRRPRGERLRLQPQLFRRLARRQRRLPEHPGRGPDHRIEGAGDVHLVRPLHRQIRPLALLVRRQDLDTCLRCRHRRRRRAQRSMGSGAKSWSATDRSRFHNDLSYAWTLDAVTDNVNSSKGDSDPAQWLPPLASARCAYATHWVAVKYRWRLSINPAEKTRLASILSGTCG